MEVGTNIQFFIALVGVVTAQSQSSNPCAEQIAISRLYFCLENQPRRDCQGNIPCSDSAVIIFYFNLEQYYSTATFSVAVFKET